MGDTLYNLLSEAFEIALIDLLIARMYAVQACRAETYTCMQLHVFSTNSV